MLELSYSATQLAFLIERLSRRELPSQSARLSGWQGGLAPQIGKRTR